MVDTTEFNLVPNNEEEEFNLVPNNEEEEFTVDFGEVIRLAGSSDFNQLQNRPQYDGQVMTGETDIPKVPTATSELNNDSDYQTGSEVQQTINAAIANKQDKLTAGQNITISEQNVISATGLTEVDWGDIGGNLNDQIDLKDVLDAKQDTLTPGDNVTIANNIISATDTKYTAGNGLSLNGTQFSADTAVLQEKLDAGNAITIENNTINADIYPADFFTNEATDTDTGSNITLDKTIPATLKSVELYGDTEQQTYSGKNLLNPEVYQSGVNIYYPAVGFTFTNTQSSDVTCSYTDTEININTSIQHGGGAFMSPVLSAGTYHFSATVTAGSNNNARASYSILDANRTVIDRGDYGTTQVGATRNYDWTITVPSTAAYIAFSFSTSATGGGEITVSNPQLEAGSSATSYEKFVGGTASPNPDYPQDIDVVTGEQTVVINGGNQFDYSKATPGYYNSSGVYQDNDKNYTSDFIPTNGSSIILAECSTTVAFIGINEFDANKNFIKRTQTPVNRFSSLQVTPDSNTRYVRVAINKDSTSMTQESLADIQAGVYLSNNYPISLGTIELCKIGDYQDYIYKSGNDWYVHKETNKHTFTGSENWYLQTSGTPSILYCGSGVLSDAINSAVKTSIYSDHFYFTTGSGTGGCYLYNRSVFVFYGDTTTTASTFKTWLGNNNTAVYYPLATPTDTQITDDDLIADLNALAGARSYLDVTNFSAAATGTNLPALLKPEVYVKSLNGVLEYLSHI